MNNLSKDFDKAKTHALKFLSYRDHSGGELLQKLGKYYDDKTCRKALSWVIELGYVNDEIYAEKLSALLIETKHYGLRKTRYEMKLKGLSEEIIDTALEKYDYDEILEIIISIIERKYSDNLADWQGIKKTTDALARRGYDYDDIKAAISKCRGDY
jgi:regulatory protein